MLPLAVCIQIIIFNANFIILNAKFIDFNSNRYRHDFEVRIIDVKMAGERFSCKTHEVSRCWHLGNAHMTIDLSSLSVSAHVCNQAAPGTRNRPARTAGKEISSKNNSQSVRCNVWEKTRPKDRVVARAQKQQKLIEKSALNRTVDADDDAFRRAGGELYQHRLTDLGGVVADRYLRCLHRLCRLLPTRETRWLGLCGGLLGNLLGGRLRRCIYLKMKILQ